MDAKRKAFVDQMRSSDFSRNHYSFGKDGSGCFALMEESNGAREFFALSGFRLNYNGKINELRRTPKKKQINDKKSIIREIKNLFPGIRIADTKDNAVVPICMVTGLLCGIHCGKSLFCRENRRAFCCSPRCFLTLAQTFPLFKCRIDEKKVAGKVENLFNCCERALISTAAKSVEDFQKKNYTIYSKWAPCESRGCNFVISACKNVTYHFLFLDYKDYLQHKDEGFTFNVGSFSGYIDIEI